MDVPDQRLWEIQWHEGMLLSPQHFQQQQRYRESERLHELFLQRPYYWGVYDLTIERALPAGNSVSVKRLYGVMPDGLIVNYFADKDPPLELDLEAQEEIVEGKEAVPVHLAVPIRTRAAASSREAAIRRFDSIPGDVEVDENTGEGEVSIARLRPKLELLATANPRATHVTLPLFHVRQDLVGVYQLTPYVGPMLRMPPREFLDRASVTESLYRLIAAIRDKATRLDKLSRSAANNLTREQRVEKRRTAIGLSAGLPELEVLLDSGRAHPFEVYRVLATMVGAFARFSSSDSIPPPLPRYRHDDVQKCIGVAAMYIEKVVDGIDVAFSIVPFEKDEPGRFSLALTPKRMSSRLTLVLHANESGRDADLRHFAATARIATRKAFEETLKFRLLGATRKLRPAQEYLRGESNVSQIVIEVDAEKNAKYVAAGEELIVARSDETPDDRLPDGIALYASHET